MSANLGLTPFDQPQELYGKEVSGDWTVAQSDISQGSMGDCFLLAPLMEIIRQGQMGNHPNFIPGMITQNPNGTETVKLYQCSGQNQFFTAKPIYETVSNVFDPTSVNNNPYEDLVGGVKEIWPQVIEKAYAQLVGGYSALAQGGFPIAAMEALTGQQATTTYPFEQTYSSLRQLTDAKDMIVFETAWAPSNVTPQGLVSSHCYAFEGYTQNNTAIAVGNPWGPTAGPNLNIPIANLGTDFDLMAVGKV